MAVLPIVKKISEIQYFPFFRVEENNESNEIVTNSPEEPQKEPIEIPVEPEKSPQNVEKDEHEITKEIAEELKKINDNAVELQNLPTAPRPMVSIFFTFSSSKTANAMINLTKKLFLCYENVVLEDICNNSAKIKRTQPRFTTFFGWLTFKIWLFRLWLLFVVQYSKSHNFASLQII